MVFCAVLIGAAELWATSFRAMPPVSRCPAWDAALSGRPSKRVARAQCRLPKLRDLDLDCDDKVTALVFGHRGLMRERRWRMCGALAVTLRFVNTACLTFELTGALR